MLHGFILPVGLHQRPDLGGSDLAILRGQGQDLVTGRLHRAGFVDMDVAGICTDRGLMGPEGGIDDRQIGLGTAHQKMNIRIRRAAGLADQPGGVGAMAVGTVAGCLFHICSNELAENGLVAALAIVTGKINHWWNLQKYNMLTLYAQISPVSIPGILPCPAA